jgi:hypothetical protein
MMKTIDPHYYRNPSNVLGLSLDEGETLILPTGKVIPIRHDIWEFDSDVLEEELSPVQEGFLARHREKPPMTEIEELAWKLHKGTRSLHATFKTPKWDAPRKEKTVQESAIAVCSDPLD